MSDTLNQRDALKRRPSWEWGGIFLGGTWHFWLNENVGTTSQVLRGAAKRWQGHTHTHTLELPPSLSTSLHASEKCWRQVPLKNLMNEVDTFFFVFFSCIYPFPHPASWAYISVCSLCGLSVDRNRVWSAYRQLCSSNLSVLVSVSVSFSVSLYAHYNKMFPRKFSYLLSY